MASGWWDDNGAISGCVAAYQPVGAASLAASYVNLANPGTYDAAPGTAPTFDASTGWTFNGTSTYLTTGITPASGTWSVLVRYSNGVAGGALLGYYQSVDASAAFLIYIDTAQMQTANGQDFPGGYASNAPILTSGVYGIAGKTPYRNGAAESNTISATNNPLGPIYIGGLRVNGSPGFFVSAKIQAIAIYSATLTSGQIASVSASMAALSTQSIVPHLAAHIDWWNR